MGNFNTINNVGKATVLVTNLKAGRPELAEGYTFTVANDSKIPAYAVKLNLKNLDTGETILPAYFSDGYFNLLPGEKKEISVDFPGRMPDKVR